MKTFCGYIALVGRPNVGKSTLLNCMLDQKVSITSNKPQTTRHRILGVQTEGAHQYVFVDTPGIHQTEKKAINKMMNKTAINVLHDVEMIAFVVEGSIWRDEDEYVLSLIKKVDVPCILVVNKIDMLKDKDTLLPWIEEISKRHAFHAVVPVSARKGTQVPRLQEIFQTLLPESPHYFPEDQCTDRTDRFMCSELVREKIFRLCGQELPYSSSIEIESFKNEEKVIRIHVLIMVDKENHKRMIIGDKGAKLKEIATRSRIDMEKMLGKKVFLQCWCKVKSGWLDNERLLKRFGYDK